MEKIVIRKSSGKLYGMAILSGVFILIYFFAPFDKSENMYKSSPILNIILSIFLFGIFFYSIAELIMKKGEIILDKEGIEIRSKGWNDWGYVNSCWTILERDSENSNKQYLIIQLKDLRELKCMISDLDKSREEIIDLIRLYKEDIIYNGQEIK